MKKLWVLLTMLVFVLLLSTVCSAMTFNDFEYELSGETVTITGYNGSEKNVVIPAEIDGCPVTCVGTNAFSNNSTLESITFPATITRVDSSFTGCDNLKRFYAANLTSWLKTEFSSSLLSNGAELYVSGVLLTDLVIPQEVTQIKSNVLTGYKSLERVMVHDKVVTLDLRGCENITTVYIDDLAAWCEIDFAGNTSNPLYYAETFYVGGTQVTGTLSIPDTTTRIKNYVFWGFKGITEVFIPSSVIEIAPMAFMYCDGLKEIYVSANNSAYSDDDGVLFNKDRTQLLIYPMGNERTTYTVPDTVTTLGDSAFRGCKYIEEVTVGDGVSTIGMCVFQECDKLTKVTLGRGIQRIGNYSFYQCPQFKILEIKDIAAWCGLEYQSDNSAFEGGVQLYLNGQPVKNLVIPEGVTKICSRVFWGCSGIESVLLPESVTNIEGMAFFGCANLAHVWYMGDETAFANIQGTAGLGTVTWHYDACPVGAEHSYDNICDTQCNVCEEVRTVPHDYGWVIDSEGNCGVDGKKHEECTVCHAKRSEDTTIPATGDHTYTNDCDPECNLCKQTRTVEHAFVWVVDLPAGCGDEGLQHEECTVCHIMQSKNTKIPATGDHVYDDEEDSNCNVCNQTRESGHEFRWVTEKEPTCGVAGSKYEKCAICDEVRNENTEIPALSHTMGQWVIVKEATCVLTGEKAKECALCGYKEVATMPILAHNFVPSSTSKKPTCTEEGKDVVKCNLCGKEETTVLKATGHKYGKSVVVKEATEAQTGLRQQTCEVCGVVKEEQIPPITVIADTPDKPFWWFAIVGAVLSVSGIVVLIVFKKRNIL